MSEASISVWFDCEICEGTAIHGGGLCKTCNGLGKKPVFIPLNQLNVPIENHSGSFSGIVLTRAVDIWLEKQKKAAEPPRRIYKSGGKV